MSTIAEIEVSTTVANQVKSKNPSIELIFLLLPIKLAACIALVIGVYL